MNISSLVVKTAPEHLAPLLETLRSSGLCDVFFHDEKGRIIVTIEGETVGEELEKVRKIQGLQHVLAADLAYAYCEEEIRGSRELIERRLPGNSGD